MRIKPTISYMHIREYAERFDWIDPITNRECTGFNPPSDALRCRRHPFHIIALTQCGKLIEGNVICLNVNTSQHTRTIQFVDSNETRQVSDLLIIEIDGVRFQVH